MFFQPVDLTTALRPSLQPDETLLFVQDAIGLYDGKYKIPKYQNGHAYLTSHRICYVDVEDPRGCSVGIDLKDVDRIDFQARFLRSSPKISLVPRRRVGGGAAPTSTGTSTSSTAASTPTNAAKNVKSEARTATWVCPICSFSNPVPSNFDPALAASTAIPPCLACGIRPPLTTLLKAAISASTSSSTTPAAAASPSTGSTSTGSASSTSKVCPRCTFANHPSLQVCEICGASLGGNGGMTRGGGGGASSRTDSPAPFGPASRLEGKEAGECVKLSFRAGGERVFHERLRGALVQRKWILQDAPPVPKVDTMDNNSITTTNNNIASGASTKTTAAGIAGLERRGLETRRNNEAVIGGAFEDLEALMASAREVVALAETFARERRNDAGVTDEEEEMVSQSAAAAALGMITTKQQLLTSSSSSSSSLYVTELSRNLAEYLTDERGGGAGRGLLRRAGGIMSLVDVWAAFNRARNGVELVSPRDFHSAAEQWEVLRLPVRLRRFRKSGLLVVQRSDWTDEKTLHQLSTWLQDTTTTTATTATSSSSSTSAVFGRGVTAQEAGEHFGWSLGVASEELEMAEERGLLCREQGVEGLRFWINHF
ncbi:vacuolar protein-sorting-associated protein 36 [Nannizzia gypsea CBS 118893]|uniref:Vacuolar protein-sorting-associated protein 36 n=1 Tax=Arthroderma gypseum (strain ATCC MYA-4604 / CBS 118893) TaxID=535722 RepID=E4V662_ARTGP|nr:vacuolar protein-sorting-associated protein 36 [Nannizzia gypsea CBS 118893]EFR05245.1 vacuolar protein-sorting-associated protein 36 [Nannizzia gypsea CBS 118893]